MSKLSQNNYENELLVTPLHSVCTIIDTESKRVTSLPVGKVGTLNRYAPLPFGPSSSAALGQTSPRNNTARRARDYVKCNSAAAFGEVKYLGINLYDRTHLSRTTKYYTHMVWKWRRRGLPLRKLDLYLNFVSLRSWRKARQEREGRWTDWYAERQRSSL